MRMTLGDTLLLYPTFVEGIRRAFDRGFTLTSGQLAVTSNNTSCYIFYEATEQFVIGLIEKDCIVFGSRYSLGFLVSLPFGALRINRINFLETNQFHDQFDWNIAVQTGVVDNVRITVGEWTYMELQAIAFDMFHTLLNAVGWHSIFIKIKHYVDICLYFPIGEE